MSSVQSPLPCLMIVDDDPLIREGLAVSFEKHYQVHLTESRANCPPRRSWPSSTWGCRPCRIDRTKDST